MDRGIDWPEWRGQLFWLFEITSAFEKTPIVPNYQTLYMRCTKYNQKRSDVPILCGFNPSHIYTVNIVLFNTILTLHRSVGVGGRAQENPSFKMKYLPRFWLVLSLASHCLAGTTVTSTICSSLSLTGPRCEAHTSWKFFYWIKVKLKALNYKLFI